MKVINIHTRIINQPKKVISELLTTLATKDDLIWPKENWPAIRFKNGINLNTKGGHGPIKYTIEEYNLEKIIQFRFTKPKGFLGIHKFELKELNNSQTEIKHIIDINTNFRATLNWIFIIRPLHDALIEDAFDKLENNFSSNKKKAKWSFWVKFIRKIMKA